MTSADLLAARAFRAAQRAALKDRNARDKPDITVSVLIRHYRHDCAKQGGRSAALELREHYIFSPALSAVPAGRFGFIFTQGRCAACGTTARSGDSRLVDSAVRPPGPRAVVSGR